MDGGWIIEVSPSASQGIAKRGRGYRMSREQGMRLQEIAEALGISKRTVEAHLSTALNTLRRVALAMKSFLL